MLAALRRTPLRTILLGCDLLRCALFAFDRGFHLLGLGELAVLRSFLCGLLFSLRFVVLWLFLDRLFAFALLGPGFLFTNALKLTLDRVARRFWLIDLGRIRRLRFGEVWSAATST